jgi:hypothetical protein
LALRKALRDQIDTTLLAAMERVFDKAGAQDKIIHVPKLHVRVRISGKDELAGELARGIEEELRTQLSTMVATAGRASLALQTGSSGEGSTGRAGFAGLAPAGMDASAGEMTASPQARARMLLHYLETGSLPWPLAQVDRAAAISELRDTASTDPSGVLDRLTGEPVFLPARVAFWFRWLQLLPDERWPVLARAAAPSSSGQGARLAEIIGALSGEQVGALSRYARLQLAAAAIARARRTGDLADVGELASIVLHVLGGGGAGGMGGVEWAERIASSGTSATSGSDSHARSSGGAEDHASGAGNGGNEDDRTASAGTRGVDGPGGGGASGLVGSGASTMSGSGARARTSGGNDSHASGTGDGAGENNRASSSDKRRIAEQARLRAASELTARMPEPAAAAFRSWLGAPSGPLHAEDPASRAAVETGATRELRAGEPLPPGKLYQPRPEPDLAALLRAREGSSRNTDARSAPFGQMVHHAGLVLLHPFLPRFFESTGIKEADKPTLASDALPRAAALLYLLAAGEEEVFELELDFIKVLLGLSLDSPLPVSEGLLLASDREEVEALLSAVVGHWRVLKSTSVKGLRGSFLQRPGLLREEEQGFRLQVESAPFDMLLGQLPWGIGTVKLPWMKKAIFTEWQAP